MNGSTAPWEGGSFSASVPPPLGYLIFQAFFLSVVIIITVLGNVAVCYVVYRTQSITTVTGMCITSLALADLFRGILVLPFVIFASIFGWRWETGDLLCSLSGLWYTLFGTASVMTLAVVSIDRYVAILKPLKYTSIITTTRAAFFICMIWLVSILMALLPIIGWSQYDYSPWNGICIPNWMEYKPYACFYLCVSFILPFSVLGFCYYNIFKVARHQSRRVMSLEVTSVNGRGSTGLVLHSGRRANNRPRLVMKKEKKAAMTLFAVMGVFILCVTPYNVVHLAFAFEGTFNLLVALGVTSMLSFVNSAANPLIYGILNRKFRHVFLGVMMCHYCPRCCGSRDGLAGFHQNDMPSDMPTASVGRRLKPVPRDSGYITSYTQTTTTNSGSNRGALPEVFSISVTSTSNTLACLGGNMKAIAKIAQGQLPVIEDTSSDEESAIPNIIKSRGLPHHSKIGLRARFLEVSEAPPSSRDNSSDPIDVLHGTSTRTSKDSGFKSPVDDSDFRLILSPSAF